MINTNVCIYYWQMYCNFKENKMKNKITKCNKWLVGFTLVASIAFSGCDAIGGGSYCDDKDGQKIFTELLKEYLLKSQDLQKYIGKNQKDLREYIDKVDFLYEMDKEHSITNEDEKSATCIVKNITIKFDKGDSVVINGAFSDGAKTAMNFLGALAGKYQLGNELSSRFIYFMGYEQNKKTKETRIEVIAPLFSQTNILMSEFFKDIPKNIIDYYDGTGVLIDGKRKGACPDGVRQTRDKNGEIAFEGGCANGTKEGAWKYYENGFLAKEELYKNGLLDKATEYYPIVGKIKSSYTTDGNGNATLRIYNKEGYIAQFVPFSIDKNGNKVVNGKAFAGRMFPSPGTHREGFYKSKLKELGIEKILEKGYCPESIIFADNFNYVEVSNGVFVLGQKLSISGELEKVKTEQEAFALIEQKDKCEVIRNDNLVLAVELSRVADGVSARFYKNDEEIGDLFNYESSGYCTTGQCQVMFKELIDKSFYKDKIYSALESTKPKE